MVVMNRFKNMKGYVVRELREVGIGVIWEVKSVFVL